MARLLIHAGFHKTGTTSLQRLLDHNERALAPVARIHLRRSVAPACDIARSYSVRRQPEQLLDFSAAFAEFLETLDPDDSRDIILSSEDLSGLMPGRRNVVSYKAVPLLMKTLQHTVDKVLPKLDEVIFYFSLRDAESWLRSCHTQHLRAIRMTLTPEEYAQNFANSANLPRIIEKTRIAVRPHRLATALLADFSDAPLGPLEPIADLLGWPPATRDAIEMLPPANVSIPPILREEFLRINRRFENKADLRRAKEQARKRFANKTD